MAGSDIALSCLWRSQSFFCVGRSAVSSIMRETYNEIWSTQFYVSETRFEEEWNLPHCIGANDGKHVAIECPPNEGSGFFNYKKFNSILLPAVCDAQYCFTFVEIGPH